MQDLAGILLVAGFVLVLAASFVGPRGVFQAPDNQTRLRIISENITRWRATNLLWAAGSLMTAGGLLAMSIFLRTAPNAWWFHIAAGSSIIGWLAWACYLYLRIGNPEGYLYASPPARLSLVFAWGVSIGSLIYGLAFITGGFPSWLGIAVTAGSGLVLAALIFAFETMYALFPPQFFNLLTFLIGIVLLQK